MSIDLHTQTIVDALADAVRRRILTGEIPAGARLTEQEVATLYGVARPTAKGAIERVVQTGILRRSANKSALVPIVSPADIEDLYRSRIFFERQVVAELAATRTVSADAQRALIALHDTQDDDSRAEAAGFDIGFHQALVDSMRSKRISKMYETIVGEAQLCVAQERAIFDPAKNWAEHKAILEAIREGQVSLVVQLIGDHLSQARARLVRAKAS
jgi:DNA-binding GntR family transcriptional regulator